MIEINEPGQNTINLIYFNLLMRESIVSKSNLDGTISAINENFTKVTGFTKEEALGKNHNIMRHPDTNDALFKDLWETIIQGKVWRGRLLSRNKNGRDFWSESTIIPLIDEKTKKISEYLCIRNDITDFLYMKRNIYAQQFHKAGQKKIAAAKDSFLVLFTHELKTPLNAIINFSKYLSKNIGKVPPEKQKKLLDQVTLSSVKMLEDVTQLLELSKLKSNKLVYNLSSFNVFDALDEVLESHNSLIVEKNVEIIKSYEYKLCTIHTDFYRFKQILSNIISNAIKYSRGTIKLDMNGTANVCNIMIEDNGPGIKDKVKVLELFEQAEGDVKTRNEQGTGIGLNFVKHLCENLELGYRLEDSRELGGLKFTITVQRERVE